MAARGRSRSSGSAVGKPAAPAAKQSTNRNQLYSLIAGGLAGSISSTLTCPIEVVKMQLQSSNGGSANPMVIAKDIARLEGVKGFFRGLSPTLLGIFPSRATYFWAYESTKRVLTPRLGDGTLTHIGAGFAAGMVSNTITNPIWMVKTRMQLLANAAKGQVAYTGYRHAVKSILKEEGVRGFYKGLSASYWGCSEGCIQFVAYEKLKRHLEARHAEHCRANGLPVTDRLPPYQYFLGAAACKFLATVTTYPHEVVRTRLREQAKNGVFRYTGMWQSIMLIGKEEGRKGLYAGMGTHVARVVPNTAIMFLSYELINTWLDKRQNGQGGGRGGPQEQDPLEELIPVDE
ncbi:mitochondrial carrier domain-containing protein [Tribonema minus]|uniref:Mitochondrial carrier domain-containing protein n=1 Tax=Tribonema minus TaxID=303371 RepID=A0A836CGB6_9STRA|nr:mitochondrial carrier domain-containing protein [Tribonema minus]